MPNVALFDMAGNKKGEIELKAEVFGCEVNEPVLHSVVRAYQDVETKRNRPCKTGFNPFSAVDTRRYRSRTEAPQLESNNQQEGKETGYEVGS